MLTKKLVKEEVNDRELLSEIFSFLSVDAHKYTVLNSVTENEKGFSIESVRAPFNTNKYDNKFMLTRSMLIFASLKFTVSTFPEYESNLSTFIQRILPKSFEK